MEPLWEYQLGVKDSEYRLYLAKLPFYADLIRRLGGVITRVPFCYSPGSKLMLWGDSKRFDEVVLTISEEQMWNLEDNFVRTFNFEAPDV